MKTKIKKYKKSSNESLGVFPILNTPYSIHHTRRGFVLPFSVLLAGILLSIGLAIFSITLKELILSSVGRDSQIAFFAADAGAECALYWDLRHPNFSTSIFDTYTTGTSTSGTTDPIGFGAVSSSGVTNASTLTYAHTIRSNNNRMLVVGVEAESTSANGCVVSSVTYGGVPLTSVGSVQAGSSTLMCVSLWYLIAPASGTANVVVTRQLGAVDISSGAMSIYNAAQTAPEASNTNSNANASSISTTLTTSTVGAWLIDAIGSGTASVGPGGGEFTATASGQTERYDYNNSSSRGAGSTREIATPGLSTMSWNRTGSSISHLAHIVAAFAPFQQQGFSQGGTAHGSVPLESDAKCGDSDITNPITGWNSGTGPDAGGWYTEATETGATTVFDMSFGNGTCALVRVTKDNGTTRIDSRGYNTCAEGNSRRVERGLRVRY